MKFLCDSCEHLGLPVAIWRSGDRVALECQGCHSIHPIRMEAPPPAIAEPTTKEERTAEREEVEAPAERARSKPAPSKKAQPKPTHQCPKCGHRQDQNDTCDRCGFAFELYKEGEMPWEYINDTHREEADALWEAALSYGDHDRHQSFLNFCMENDLADYAGRRYRFRLADHPEDEISHAQLDKMAFQAREVLFTRLEGQKSDMVGRSERAKKWIVLFALVVILIFGTILFVSFPNLFS